MLEGRAQREPSSALDARANRHVKYTTEERLNRLRRQLARRSTTVLGRQGQVSAESAYCVNNSCWISDYFAIVGFDYLTAEYGGSMDWEPTSFEDIAFATIQSLSWSYDDQDEPIISNTMLSQSADSSDKVAGSMTRTKQWMPTPCEWIDAETDFQVKWNTTVPAIGFYIASEDDWDWVSCPSASLW